jgi:hypothetical protein
MKRATIFDEAAGVFGVEYDNTIGKKHSMRLEAATYDEAVTEARSFLGIREDDRDAAGDIWTVE